MQVEATLVRRTLGQDKPSFRSEVLAWVRLFDGKYIDRTLIGIFIMFFQRKHTASHLVRTLINRVQNGVVLMRYSTMVPPWSGVWVCKETRLL